MKEYMSPKIKAVSLDADQAILQLCAVEGLYLNNSTFCITMTGTRTIDCNVSVRGRKDLAFQTLAPPSYTSPS